MKYLFDIKMWLLFYAANEPSKKTNLLVSTFRSSHLKDLNIKSYILAYSYLVGETWAKD
jgi:hypothetical protein